MNTEYSGTGDPARSLALLWRTREPASRNGHPDLSVDRIVHTAAAAFGLARILDGIAVLIDARPAPDTTDR